MSFTKFFLRWMLVWLLIIVGLAELIIRVTVVLVCSIPLFGVPLIVETERLRDFTRPMAFKLVPMIWSDTREG